MLPPSNSRGRYVDLRTVAQARLGDRFLSLEASIAIGGTFHSRVVGPLETQYPIETTKSHGLAGAELIHELELVPASYEFGSHRFRQGLLDHQFVRPPLLMKSGLGEGGGGVGVEVDDLNDGEEGL